MKSILFYLTFIFALTGYSQQITLTEWNEQAKTNIRMLPKYGNKKKTSEQKQADEQFINETMELEQYNGDRRAASNHLIQLGFTYLYNGDIKVSMYRFNQAYLLDSTNSDIYWGYGAVYMTLGDFERAKQQYLSGISVDPKNSHLLTDYGTYFMSQYSNMIVMPANDLVKNPKEQAFSNLDSALLYLNRSFQLDSKNKNTAYKLSTSYYYKGDCTNAWKYYDACKTLGGQQPITEKYTRELKMKCKGKK